jgi:HD-GYP domain-containing protein (c-di-GMP phosphodiesterase class II)
MEQIAVAELTAGMIIGKDVLSAKGHLLLKRGHCLDTASIRLLQNTSIATVYIGTEEEPETPSSVPLMPRCPLDQESLRLLEKALTGFEQQSVARHLLLNEGQIQTASQILRQEIFSHDSLSAAIKTMQAWNDRLWQHCVNTAVIAVILAKELKYTEAMCRHVAIGMLFHDYGHIFLPRAVLEKQGKLLEGERRIAQEHPRAGYEQLAAREALSSEALDIVLHHHERLDGSGYPDGLRGEAISPLTRLAAVVEVFDAMTSVRPGARAVPPEAVMRELMQQMGTGFDQAPTLMLAQHVVLFPNGTAVQLNTGEIGIVVETSPGSAARPLVRLFYDAEGRRIRAYELNLAQQPSRFIAHTGESVMQLKDMLETDTHAAA